MEACGGTAKPEHQLSNPGRVAQQACGIPAEQRWQAGKRKKEKTDKGETDRETKRHWEKEKYRIRKIMEINRCGSVVAVGSGLPSVGGVEIYCR